MLQELQYCRNAFLLVLVVTGAVNAVIYQTSTQNWRLQNLANFELKAVNFLKSNIKEKLNFIQRFESRFLKVSLARSSGISRDDYINNPLPALVLIRRLVEDWTSLAWVVRENYGLSQLGLGAVRWPSTRDLDAAALTVMRAQWTYNLDIGSLAGGTAGNYSLFNVTAADCFHMASACCKYLFIEEALVWLKQAFNKINLGDSSFPAHTLMHYFALFKCLSGDSKSTRTILIELFRKYPLLKITHQEKILKAYMDMSMLNCSRLSGTLGDQRKSEWYENLSKDELEHHSRLCRGEAKTDSTLSCRYVHYRQPHLRFQPFKLEELHLDPPVVRFYDVVSDIETEILKEFLSKKLDVSATLTLDGSLEESTYRTSHSGWIYPRELDVNDRLSQRMGEITQLNHETAEPNQMSRYSISGEYLPHYDFLYRSGVPFLYDRIATLMFYLNDVKEGGNTVFLDWNLTVKPVKNSAVLWFNYCSNGEPDTWSKHSGCPVLQGTKWVLNKWFHNEGNEFKKPCGLHPDDSFRSYYLQ